MSADPGRFRARAGIVGALRPAPGRDDHEVEPRSEPVEPPDELVARLRRSAASVPYPFLVADLTEAADALEALTDIARYRARGADRVIADRATAGRGRPATNRAQAHTARVSGTPVARHTVEEFARMTHRHPTSVRRAIRAGCIPATKVGRRAWLIEVEEEQ